MAMAKGIFNRLARGPLHIPDNGNRYASNTGLESIVSLVSPGHHPDYTYKARLGVLGSLAYSNRQAEGCPVLQESGGEEEGGTKAPKAKEGVMESMARVVEDQASQCTLASISELDTMVGPIRLGVPHRWTDLCHAIMTRCTTT